MIAKPKGQDGLFNSQGEVDEPGPREYLRTGGERGQTVDERDKRKPNVKTSSPSSSTDPGFLFFGSDRSSSNGQTVVEVKTGSDPRDRSNGNFLTQFFSPEGTSKQACIHACKQASKQACMQASKQACKQASKHACKQACK